MDNNILFYFIDCGWMKNRTLWLRKGLLIHQELILNYVKLFLKNQLYILL